MINDVIHAATAHLLTQYLSLNGAGPWTIGEVCISARAVPIYGQPADAQVTRVLLEQLTEGWSVAIHVACRGGKLWHHRIESYFDDTDRLGVAGARLAYLDWLRSL